MGKPTCLSCNECGTFIEQGDDVDVWQPDIYSGYGLCVACFDARFKGQSKYQEHKFVYFIYGDDPE